MPQNQAAKSFNVPDATLGSKINSEQEPALTSKKKLSRFVPIYSAETESGLKNHLLEMDKRFFGLSTTEIHNLAFEYAEKISHIISTENNIR